MNEIMLLDIGSTLWKWYKVWFCFKLSILGIGLFLTFLFVFLIAIFDIPSNGEE